MRVSEASEHRASGISPSLYGGTVTPPTWIIIATNTENGHAHLIYGLKVSIRTAPDGKSKPLRYAAAVESALRDKLGANIGLCGTYM
ncbi:replication initiation protein [Vibrio harveyi]